MSAALWLSGLGSLAGAWGQYKTGKRTAKVAQEKLDYEKSRDKIADSKMDLAQTNLDDAFSNSILNKKKKKTNTENDTLDTPLVTV